MDHVHEKLTIQLKRNLQAALGYRRLQHSTLGYLSPAAFEDAAASAYVGVKEGRANLYPTPRDADNSAGGLRSVARNDWHRGNANSLSARTNTSPPQMPDTQLQALPKQPSTPIRSPTCGRSPYTHNWTAVCHFSQDGVSQYSRGTVAIRRPPAVTTFVRSRLLQRTTNGP